MTTDEKEKDFSSNEPSRDRGEAQRVSLRGGRQSLTPQTAKPVTAVEEHQPAVPSAQGRKPFGAFEEASKFPVAMQLATQRVSQSGNVLVSERLAMMPLTLLLPRLGELRLLPKFRPFIVRRHESLAAEKASLGEEVSKEMLGEEGMLAQVMQWLTMGEGELDVGEFEESKAAEEPVYSAEVFEAIFALATMYFEMGYFLPAERIFAGLVAIDSSWSPARLGLGVVKLERGLFEESLNHFRAVIQTTEYPLQAKLGLVAGFTALGEIPRAKSILISVATELERTLGENAELRALWEVFAIRCDTPM